jgi:hypothetical protein
MKKILILAATMLAAAHGQTPSFQTADTGVGLVFLLPETNRFTLQWEHARDESSVYYDLYLGTNAPGTTNWVWNKFQTISTNDFTAFGVTNGLTTLKAGINGLPRGTNVVAMVSVSSALGNISSAPSSNLWLNTLPFPSPPQGLRKP